MTFQLVPARSPEHVKAAEALFTAYANSLGVDLGYQDFDAELSALPGKYAPPTGELLIAFDATGCALGCVALRVMTEPGVCEIKRLYVSPEGRGLGLGGALIDAILNAARDLGYRETRLDTLPTMSAAISLHEKRGFKRIASYYDAALPGTYFFAKSL